MAPFCENVMVLREVPERENSGKLWLMSVMALREAAEREIARKLWPLSAEWERSEKL